MSTSSAGTLLIRISALDRRRLKDMGFVVTEKEVIRHMACRQTVSTPDDAARHHDGCILGKIKERGYIPGQHSGVVHVVCQTAVSGTAENAMDRHDPECPMRGGTTR